LPKLMREPDRRRGRGVAEVDIESGSDVNRQELPMLTPGPVGRSEVAEVSAGDEWDEASYLC